MARNWIFFGTPSRDISEPSSVPIRSRGVFVGQVSLASEPTVGCSGQVGFICAYTRRLPRKLGLSIKKNVVINIPGNGKRISRKGIQHPIFGQLRNNRISKSKPRTDADLRQPLWIAPHEACTEEWIPCYWKVSYSSWRDERTGMEARRHRKAPIVWFHDRPIVTAFGTYYIVPASASRTSV